MGSIKPGSVFYEGCPPKTLLRGMTKSGESYGLLIEVQDGQPIHSDADDHVDVSGPITIINSSKDGLYSNIFAPYVGKSFDNVGIALEKLEGERKKLAKHDARYSELPPVTHPFKSGKLKVVKSP